MESFKIIGTFITMSKKIAKLSIDFVFLIDLKVCFSVVVKDLSRQAKSEHAG